MEINLKINFPENSAQNQNKIPKSFKISYSFDFNNGEVNSNSNEIKADDANLNGNIILNIKGNENNKVEVAKEPSNNNIILKSKEENKVENNNYNCNASNNNEINNTPKNNEENDNQNPLYQSKYSSNNNNNNEEPWESSENKNKYEKNFKNYNPDSTRYSFNSNMYSKRSFEIRGNYFRGRGRGRGRGFEKDKLYINNQTSDISINKFRSPSDAIEDIFVSGIADDMTDDDMIITFSNFGEVVSCKIPKDKSTQKVKGFAFLKFKEKQSAFLAMMNADKIICKGKYLKIHYNNRMKEPKDYSDKNNIQNISEINNNILDSPNNNENDDNNQIEDEGKKSENNDENSHYSIRERSREKDKEEGEA